MQPNQGPASLEVVVGTYEQFLVGFQLVQDGETIRLEQSFTNHAHNGSIRALAANRKWVVSGGSDEVIRILCMKKRADIGSVMNQEGTITSLQFFEDTHLFSGSEDGTICVFDTNGWNCLKTLRGHKGAVNAMSIHPSGKMLLSVSKDKSLRTWNLIKGRCAYITNLKAASDHVWWAPNGKDFLVALGSRLDVYNISQGGISLSLDLDRRISCVAFLSKEVFCVGGDSETIDVCHMKQEKPILRFKAHENRLKGLVATFGLTSDKRILLFSVSSDGFVKLWQFDQVDKEPRLMATADTTCRPLCLTVFASNSGRVFLDEPSVTIKESCKRGATLELKSGKNKKVRK